MRDYETRPELVDNKYVRYPEYYHLMINSGMLDKAYLIH
jgi:hypothetical protein